MCDRLLQSGRVPPPQIPGRIRSGQGLQPNPGPAVAAVQEPLDPGQAQLEDTERTGAGPVTGCWQERCGSLDAACSTISGASGGTAVWSGPTACA